jgi:hypothetical protein
VILERPARAQSPRPFRPRDGWGPAAAAALCITFDNFGEAAELEMGW